MHGRCLDAISRLDIAMIHEYMKPYEQSLPSLFSPSCVRSSESYGSTVSNLNKKHLSVSQVILDENDLVPLLPDNLLGVFL